MPDANTLWTILATLLVTTIGGMFALWRHSKPGRERANAMADAILGVEEVRDRAGQVMRSGQPGLVALQKADSDRLKLVEEAVVEFRHVIGIYTEVLKRVDNIETRITALEATHVKDIVTAAERAATAAASAEMLRLANERDVIEGEVE